MTKQALEGKRLNSFGVDPEKLIIIGLDTKDGEEHPLYDERVFLPLNDPMVRNIMVHGILEDVIVVEDGPRTLVVAGRQRVRCAREANKRLKKQGGAPILVPCKVRRGDDGEMLSIMISENEIRREDSILAKAKKVQRFLNLGRTEADASIHFGVTETAIKNWLKVLGLSTGVKKAVDDGRISATAAVKLADLPRDKQDKELKKLLAAAPSGRVSVQKAKAVVTGKKAAPGKREIGKIADALGNDPMATLLGWVVGEVDEKELFARCPAVRRAFLVTKVEAKNGKGKAHLPVEDDQLALPMSDEDASFEA